MIILANVQSLLPKIDECHAILSIKQPDIFCITETWLTEDIGSSLINTQNYSICRNDRKLRHGGGTAIFIRNSVSYRYLCCNSVAINSNEFEITMLELCDYRMFVFLLIYPSIIDFCIFNELKRVAIV